VENPGGGGVVGLLSAAVEERHYPNANRQLLAGLTPLRSRLEECPRPGGFALSGDRGSPEPRCLLERVRLNQWDPSELIEELVAGVPAEESELHRTTEMRRRRTELEAAFDELVELGLVVDKSKRIE
jgi:hypothetical protein